MYPTLTQVWLKVFSISIKALSAHCAIIHFINFCFFFLVWINDQSNVAAAEAIEVGLNQPPAGVKVVGKEIMSSDTTEVVSAIAELCGKLEAMVDAGTPPDIVIDSTRVGIVSDVVKTMTWTLGKINKTKTDLHHNFDLHICPSLCVAYVRRPSYIIIFSQL